MGNLFESLKNYFENTPKEVLDNDWKEIKYLNEIGPDVIEYAKFVKEQFGIAVSYSTIVFVCYFISMIYTLNGRKVKMWIL